MKAKVIVFFILSVILLYSFKYKEVKEIKQTNSTSTIEKSNKNNKLISIIIDDETKNITLDEYVIGVVACEMPASFEYEAIKAMTVSARTYAEYKLNNNKNYTFKSTVSDQCYITKDQMKEKWKNSYDKYYNKIKSATKDTENEYIMYDEKPILAMYFSISNGKTENCENVFSQKKDYLVSVDSPWDEKASFKEDKIIINLKSFLNKLSIKQDKINNIDFNRTNSGRVNYVTINDKKIKGTDFRKLFNLKSTDFTLKEENNDIIISTKGNGHGVGMSQYGANYMAEDGYKYDDILRHYYKGTKIMNK